MISNSTIILAVILVASAFHAFSATENSHVDPSWLASWEEAVASRPQVLSSFATMVSSDEPGTKLQIKGLVVDPYGAPAAGVTVHAYHRDNHGFDFGHNDKALSTWRIQGWVKTDRDGRFTFNTIKAAPDHWGREGGHIHFTVVSEQYGRQWALKAYFSDDTSLTERQKLLSKKAGEFGAIREITTTETGELIHVALKLKAKPDF